MDLIECGKDKVLAYPAFRVTCKKCGFTGLSTLYRWWADLDGEPFVDYYCQVCKRELSVPNENSEFSAASSRNDKAFLDSLKR